MEWKIGEIKQINGEWYQCVEEIGCDGCAFDTIKCDEIDDIIGKCTSDLRHDDKSVVFKKLEKVGEPIIYMSRTFQRLKSSDAGQCKYCYFGNQVCNPQLCGEESFLIEIKQNKEDMEKVDNSKEERLWEQRRYETAKEFMSVVMSRANYDPINAPIMSCSCSEEKINPYSHIATLSVQAADALIEVLKGKRG